MWSEWGFRQQVDALSQNSINNPVDVHRLANSQARSVIARLLENGEKDGKAVDVHVAIHGGVPLMTSPSLCCRIQVMMWVNACCDVRHWRKFWWLNHLTDEESDKLAGWHLGVSIELKLVTVWNQKSFSWGIRIKLKSKMMVKMLNNRWILHSFSH